MFGFDAQRSGLLVVVAAIHGAMAFALTQAGGTERSLPTFAVIETHFFEPQKPVAERPTIIASVEPLRFDVRSQAPEFELELTAPAVAPASSTAPLAMVSPRLPVTNTGPVIVENVQYVDAPKPRYPSMSRKLKEQGTVVLKVLVDERGSAKKIEVADSSGHERLDQAAVEAVAGATFRPFFENGTARAMLVLIPIEFGLHRARS
jgi:periplasmic protein TonB